MVVATRVEKVREGDSPFFPKFELGQPFNGLAASKLAG
jgi:hypothetical protein